MIAADEQALICDLAETYQIYDYKSLPPSKVATFSVGLRENSRIKMKLSGAKASQDILIGSIIADRLGLMLWAMTEDGKNGTNRPPQLLEIILGIQSGKNSDNLIFDTPEAFENARKELLEKGGIKDG